MLVYLPDHQVVETLDTTLDQLYNEKESIKSKNANMAQLREDLHSGKLRLIRHSCEIKDENGKTLIAYFAHDQGRGRNGGPRKENQHGITVSDILIF